MKAARRALAAAGALCLAGCSYIPFYQDAAKKPMPLTEISATANPKVVWSTSVGKGGDYRFVPQVDGNRVFAAAASWSSGMPLSRAPSITVSPFGTSTTCCLPPCSM